MKGWCKRGDIGVVVFLSDFVSKKFEKSFHLSCHFTVELFISDPLLPQFLDY